MGADGLLGPPPLFTAINAAFAPSISELKFYAKREGLFLEVFREFGYQVKL